MPRSKSGEPLFDDGAAVDDRLVAIGAGGDDPAGDAADFFEPADVGLRFRWQVLEDPGTLRGPRPAAERLVARRGGCEQAQVRGELGDRAAIDGVAGADL